MNITRGQFFKYIGGGLAALGVAKLSDLVRPNSAFGQQTPKKEGAIKIDWLGHGGFKFESVSGTVILLDPWLSTNPKCPAQYRNPENFEKVDILLFTHGHVDHFMVPDTEALVNKFNPMVVATTELGILIKNEIPMANVQRFKLSNKGASSAMGNVNITMVGADHSSNAQRTSFSAPPTEVGEAVGYILEFENGFKIYHAGDTGLMPDMKMIIGDYYRPDLAILPIGNVFTMGPREAAWACKWIRPKYVIPDHYGTFPALEQTADTFIAGVKEYAPETKVIVLTPGQEYKI